MANPKLQAAIEALTTPATKPPPKPHTPKGLKNRWRKQGEHRPSLREWARAQANGGDDVLRQLARQWFAGKGLKFGKVV